MSVFVLPRLMVDAFGGHETLALQLGSGEIHYTSVYPDGSIEISIKDVCCTRILVSDPTQKLATTSAKITFRSLALFGAVRHAITIPRAIDRRILRDSLFVYPSASSLPNTYESSREGNLASS